MTTVLLAAYNGEKYLKEQLASLERCQGVKRVILQDDGSSDSTPGILRQWAVEHPQGTLGREWGRHLGPVGNFFSLIRQCPPGDAALCDQDDVWHPDRISRGTDVLRRREAEVGREVPLLVHSDMRVVNETGQAIHGSAFAHQGWDPGANTLAPLLVQNNVTGCTLLMNEALLTLLQQVPPETKAGMSMHDWFIALTAASFGEVHFVADPLVDYRQHGRNVKGASTRGLLSRGIHALGAWGRGKARIALTYDQAERFLQVWRERLSEDARQILQGYLDTRIMGKCRRVLAVRRGGYMMQSPITRAGQMIFG